MGAMRAWIRTIVKGAIFTAFASGPMAALSASPADAADMTKAAIWAVGHNLSLAALLYAKGAAQAAIDDPLGKAKSAADTIGVEIKPFPPRGNSDSESGAAVIHYLIKGDGWSTGEAIAKKYGHESGVLFELAVKSNLAILLYEPGSDSGLAGIIKSRSEEIGVPAELWSPVVSAMNDGRSAEDVRNAIFKMHDDVLAALVKMSSGGPTTVGELLKAGGKRLTKDEILKGFAGATVAGAAMGFPDSKFKLSYAADGTASGEGVSPGGSTKITGFWSANDQDFYCQDLRTANGNAIKGCFPYFVLQNRLFAAPTIDPSAPISERQITR